MVRQIHFYSVFILYLIINSLQGADTIKESTNSGSKDKLFHAFKNPPSEARPFTRWWWGGNVLNAQEIARQVEAFKEAGLGGVEINPAGGGLRPLPFGETKKVYIKMEYEYLPEKPQVQNR